MIKRDPKEREQALRDAKKRLLAVLDDEEFQMEEVNALGTARRRVAELQEALTLDRELNPQLYRPRREER